MHAIVENPCGGWHILLLRHLHFGIFGLFQLCSFFCRAFLTPANLIIEGLEIYDGATHYLRCFTSSAKVGKDDQVSVIMSLYVLELFEFSEGCGP